MTLRHLTVEAGLCTLDPVTLELGRLLSSAVLNMNAGLVVVDASRRLIFENPASERVLGSAARLLQDAPGENVGVFDANGARLGGDALPLARALHGETIDDELIELERDGELRSLRISAWPIHEDGSIIAAVCNCQDVTEQRRANEAARYLAAAGAVLEQRDPEQSLQAIVDLAVPVLADWCFVHLKTDGGARIVAIANADPKAAQAARERAQRALPLSSDTAVARVLAGGPRELVDVDADVLERASRSSEHFAELRSQGYRSAVVAPLTGREGVLGAITFAMTQPSRRYRTADLDMLTELARRTGVALDSARSLAAEKRERERAEKARDRTRQLQKLTALLSGALSPADVTRIILREGKTALGAAASFAWLLRNESVLELVATDSDEPIAPLDSFTSIPLSAGLPICEAMRSGQPLTFESLAAMQAKYPHAAPPAGSPFRAWAVMPILVNGRAVGGVSFSFAAERAFSDGDREQMAAMIGQASLAFERCRLLEAERVARRAAEVARLRELQLHVLAARLSSALTSAQIAAITCEEVVAFMGAYSGAAALRVGDEVHILGVGGPRDPEALARVERVPLTAQVPIAEAIAQETVVWCPDRAGLEARYSHLEDIWRKLEIFAWGGAPFSFQGRTVGSLALSFSEPHELTTEERELLNAAGQLTAQALERARLFDAHRAAEEQLRSALTAARAGTWSLNLATLRTTRDPSYRALLGVSAEHGAGDFSGIHPEDRALASKSFERTLTEDVPYDPEVRVQRDDGSYIWVRSHARLIRDAAGKPIAVAGVVVDIDDVKRARLRAEEEQRVNEILSRLGASFAGELDHERLVRLIVDEVTKLVDAEHALFWDDASGAPAWPPTLQSQLSVPVVARSGQSFGKLMFGHSREGHFSAAHERMAGTIASQAATALENARLYRTVRDQNAKLAAAVEHARSADRRKDEFLAMLGHELRNPLAPIATALSVMDLKRDEAHRRERDVIRRQVDHLSRLVDDLLDVSRITRGKIQLNRSKLELSSVLAKAVEMASPLLEARQQLLSIDVAREGMLIDGDPVRLAQVFQNLLTNACKYSDRGSHITVRARQAGENLVIEVEDEGIGISPDVLPRLFDLFAQGDRSIDRSQGGLGIGLTVARSLCELHGGSVEAHNNHPRKGCTFVVTLPRARDDQRPEPPPERVTPVAQGGGRVLVVDDNVDAAKMLQILLIELGYESAVAHDGVAGLTAASAFQPSVALIDIGLPVLDGYEVAKRLREQPLAKPLRLVALTGYGQEADRARAFEAGFDDHLVKPVGIEALLRVLEGASQPRT